MLPHKNWNRYVTETETLALSPGFIALRDRIVELGRPKATDDVLDVGAGTGLLALELAPRVHSACAVDISPAMTARLAAKASAAGAANLKVATAEATDLPLPDESLDLVVSNYCYHHLSGEDKLRAIEEARRVLRPGGRLVFGDMMFRLSLSHGRSRAVILSKVRTFLRMGPAGLLRLLKNIARVAARRWEHPATAEEWVELLTRAGFESVHVELLEHEGGVAVARRPVAAGAPSETTERGRPVLDSRTA